MVGTTAAAAADLQSRGQPAWTPGMAQILAAPLALVPLGVVALLAERPRAAGLAFVAATSVVLGLLPLGDLLRRSATWIERHPGRLILAPLLLFIVVGCACQDGAPGVLVGAYAWGVAHAAGATRDLLFRVGAGRAGLTRTGTVSEGAAMLAWFLAAPVFSSRRLGQLLDHAFDNGLAIPTPGGIDGLRVAIAAILAVSTVAYLWALGRALRGDARATVRRAVLAATSLGVWWLCTFTFENMLVSVAVWAMCHQAQRVSPRELVRRGLGSSVAGAYLGLALALVWAFLVDSELATRAAGRLLESVLVLAALLHFYFAGYGWRLPPAGALDRGMPGYLARWVLVLMLVFVFAGHRQEEARSPASQVERYQALVAAVPDDAEAHLLLARALERAGDPAAALASARVAAGLRPGVARYDGCVLLLEALQEPAAARLRLLEHAAAVDPLSAETFYRIGHELVLQGRGEEAIPSFVRAVALDPRLTSAHFELAVQMFTNDAQLDESIEHLIVAATLSPRNSSIQNYLGWLRYQQGSTEQAIVHYSAALRLDPADLRARTNLAEMLNLLGLHPKALRHYRAVLYSDPDNFVAHKGMALGLEMQGHYGTALEHYRRAHELAPKRVDVLYTLGTMLSSWPLETLGDADEALVVANRLHRILGDDPVSFDLLGMAMAQAGRMEEAVDHARRAVDMFEANEDAPHAAEARGRLAAYESGQPFRCWEGSVEATR